MSHLPPAAPVYSRAVRPIPEPNHAAGARHAGRQGVASHHPAGWYRLLAGLLSLLVVSATGCGGRQPPVTGGGWHAGEARRVLVLVPGITGSVLRDTVSGKVAWGRGRNLIAPHDGAYRLALPIAEPPPGAAPRPQLVADGILRGMSLLGLHRAIYQPVIDLFTANGYRLGDLEAPRSDRDFFLFSFDWRQDNIRSAQQLFAALEGVRRARGGRRLDVDLVCQSNGGAVCRWLARYGDAGLEAAEAGTAGPPDSLVIHHVVLVGTSNGGSIRTLREMTRGRRYVSWVGRRFEPEVFFTVPAFFQDLPIYRPDFFVDSDGESMAVDVFDPENWLRYGWSIWSPRAKRSLQKRHPPARFFGNEKERRAHLERMLDRASRLEHRLAGSGPLAPETHYHLIQNVSWETPDRALIEPDPDGGWHLRFTGDKDLRARGALLAAITAKGDGHATRASQLYLSAAEHSAVVGEVFPVLAEHFKTILQPAAHEHLLEILSAP